MRWQLLPEAVNSVGALSTPSSTAGAVRNWMDELHSINCCRSFQFFFINKQIVGNINIYVKTIIYIFTYCHVENTRFGDYL